MLNDRIWPYCLSHATALDGMLRAIFIGDVGFTDVMNYA